MSSETDEQEEAQGTPPDAAEQSSPQEEQQDQSGGQHGGRQAQRQATKRGGKTGPGKQAAGKGRAQAIKQEGMQVARGAAQGGVKGALKAEEEDAMKRGVVKKLTERGVVMFFTTPPGWITIAALLIIIIIMMIASAGGDSAAYKKDQENAANEEQQTLTLTKTGPETAKVGDELKYTITVSETATVTEIIIIDHIPEGTAFVSASDKGKYTAENRTVTWKLTDVLPNPDKTYTSVNALPLHVVLKATQNNAHLVNWAEATSTPADTDGSYVAPNDSTCNGKYKLTNALKRNFGDPQCNFDKDKLYKILKAQDPKNAELWFNKIIPCESGYNPNAYNGNAVDARGAWGMYQMGSSTPPGQDPSKPGKNGKYDRGDTVWTIQTSNAVNYGKNISSLKAYWACAR